MGTHGYKSYYRVLMAQYFLPKLGDFSKNLDVELFLLFLQDIIYDVTP